MKEAVKNTTLADRLLFVCLLSLSLAGIFITGDALSQGSDVIIETAGKPAYRLPLDVDRVLTVEGPHGISRIEILGGKVRITEASCRNRICLREGWVSRGVIVCLPNKLVIKVGGSTKDRHHGIDAVTG